jgi:hypothetical protein
MRLTHPECLPGADNTVVERIHHVEDIALLETHLALLRLVVGEVGLDIEGVPALVLHYLVVLLPSVLGCKTNTY